MNSVSYWSKLSHDERVKFVISLASQAKKLNDYRTALLVMKTNMNNDSAFMDLFVKSLRLIFKDETISA